MVRYVVGAGIAMVAGCVRFGGDGAGTGGTVVGG